MPTSPSHTPVTGTTGSTGTGRLARFDYVTVLVSTACASCRGVFPLDALVEGCICPLCQAQLSFPPEKWREVLEPLLSKIETIPADGKLERTTGSFQFAAHRPASCPACSKNLPGDALEQAIASGQGFCPSCGHRMTARAVPTAMTSMLPGVSHVIGENADLIARPLEPRAPVGRGFLLRIDHALRNQYFPPFWGEVLAACGDPDGGVYILCTDTAKFGQLRAIGLDSELRTRWSRPNLPMGKHQDAGITITTDGVVVWAGDRVSAVKLAMNDGRELGRLGGQQPKSDRHFMDLNGAASLAGDVDGTFLMVKERRLVRCGPDGVGVATWPPRRGLFGKKQEKLYAFGEDLEDEGMAPMVDRLPDFATQVYRARIVVGWDQRVYLWSGPHIACIERDGKVRWRCSLPQGWYVDLSVAPDGTVFVLSGKELPAIWRISPDGRSATLIVDGRSHETPLSETAIVVRRDGSILTFAEKGQIRMFSAGGQLYWRTDAARLADEARVAKASIAAYGLPKSGDV
jgi:hypothetical protein